MPQDHQKYLEWNGAVSAELEQPDASIAASDYQSGRKLNKALINRLAPLVRTGGSAAPNSAPTFDLEPYYLNVTFWVLIPF